MNLQLLLWGVLAVIPAALVAQGDRAPSRRSEAVRTGLALLDADRITPGRGRGVRVYVSRPALNRHFAVGASNGVVDRGHTTLGRARTPITCDAQVMRDPCSAHVEGAIPEGSDRPNVYGFNLAARQIDYGDPDDYATPTRRLD